MVLINDGGGSVAGGFVAGGGGTWGTPVTPAPVLSPWQIQGRMTFAQQYAQQQQRQNAMLQQARESALASARIASLQATEGVLLPSQIAAKEKFAQAQALQAQTAQQTATAEAMKTTASTRRAQAIEAARMKEQQEYYASHVMLPDGTFIPKTTMVRDKKGKLVPQLTPQAIAAEWRSLTDNLVGQDQAAKAVAGADKKMAKSLGFLTFDPKGPENNAFNIKQGWGTASLSNQQIAAQYEALAQGKSGRYGPQYLTGAEFGFRAGASRSEYADLNRRLNQAGLFGAGAGPKIGDLYTPETRTAVASVMKYANDIGQDFDTTLNMMIKNQAAQQSALAAGGYGSGGGGGGPTSQTNINYLETGVDNGKQALMSVMKTELGRAPSDAEYKKYVHWLNAKESKSPTITHTSIKGDTTTSYATQKDVDPTQQAEDFVKSGALGSERSNYQGDLYLKAMTDFLGGG